MSRPLERIFGKALLILTRWMTDMNFSVCFTQFSTGSCQIHRVYRLKEDDLSFLGGKDSRLTRVARYACSKWPSYAFEPYIDTDISPISHSDECVRFDPS